ncbi:hypothetical protein [Scytonema sp. NUACC26]|uniref:hypothetical protein n=1 Tax=Scytonema sp. NUACC26 TaxID=3140176 RepID=UPI0034DCB024
MKSNTSEEQIHFQRDNISLRLGHIASNFARLRTFCHNNYEKGVLGVIAQTKDFIEWTAAEIEPELAEELVNIQIQLALWERTWDNIWSDDKKRGELATTAETYSGRVLDMSSLLLEPTT